MRSMQITPTLRWDEVSRDWLLLFESGKEVPVATVVSDGDPLKEKIVAIVSYDGKRAIFVGAKTIREATHWAVNSVKELKGG